MIRNGSKIKKFLKKRIGLFLFFILPLSSIEANNLKAHTNKTSTWPNAQELKIIQDTIKNNPIEKQLEKPVRLFLTHDSKLIITKKHYDSLQDYSQTTFREEVKFFLTHFKKTVKFILCIFEKKVVFSNVVSKKFINFEWSYFKDDASFTYNNFYNEANFYQAVFKKPVTFYSSKFGQANFTDVNFDNEAIFTRATFGKALFIESSFMQNVSFDEVYFKKDVDFSKAIFMNDVSFNRTTFINNANFSNAKFYGIVLLNRARLPKTLNLSYITHINKIIDFTNANESFDYKTKINLVGTNIQKLKFDYSFFSLNFPEDTSEIETRKIYEDLIQMQKKYGFDEGYKKIMIEYSTYKYLKNKQYLRYFFDKYMWNFGFDTTNLILLVVYIIVFFTLINNLFYIKLEREIYHIPFLNIHSENKAIERNFLLRYLFYLPLSLIYTTLIMMGGFIGFHPDFQSIQNKNIFISIYVLLMVISGLFSIFLILQYIVK